MADAPGMSKIGERQAAVTSSGAGSISARRSSCWAPTCAGTDPDALAAWGSGPRSFPSGRPWRSPWVRLCLRPWPWPHSPGGACSTGPSPSARGAGGDIGHCLDLAAGAAGPCGAR